MQIRSKPTTNQEKEEEEEEEEEVRVLPGHFRSDFRFHFPLQTTQTTQTTQTPGIQSIP